jgi:hypothetical protein
MNTEDRKKLVKEYKDNPYPMGVYLITNKVNGNMLLGSNTNIPGILNRIRFSLSKGVSGSWINSLLQADWKKYGEDNFEFITLDTLKPNLDPEYDHKDELKTLLSLWEDKLSNCAYNNNPEFKQRIQKTNSKNEFKK